MKYTRKPKYPAERSELDRLYQVADLESANKDLQELDQDSTVVTLSIEADRLEQQLIVIDRLKKAERPIRQRLKCLRQSIKKLLEIKQSMESTGIVVKDNPNTLSQDRTGSDSIPEEVSNLDDF